MKKRKSFKKLYLSIAQSLAERSSCNRLQVGCLITTLDNTRILAGSYNGSPSGFPNECPNGPVKGNCGDTCAEQNCLLGLIGVSINQPLHLWCTHSPCQRCASLIIQSKVIHKVTYITEYRDKTGIDMLRQSGILVTR